MTKGELEDLHEKYDRVSGAIGEAASVGRFHAVIVIFRDHEVMPGLSSRIVVGGSTTGADLPALLRSLADGLSDDSPQEDN
jgi:hypothetical protein